CITARSTVQKHLLDHLRRYVETRPEFIDGWPHHPASIHGRCTPLWPDGSSFYVCPTTGRLLRPRGPRTRPHHLVHRLSELRQLRCINGVWFLIELVPIPSDWREYRGCYDVLLKRSLNMYGMGGRNGLLRATYGRQDVYAGRKWQPRAQHIPHLLRQAE